MQKIHNFGRMTGFCLRGSSLLEHTKKNNPVTLCLASPTLDCTWDFFFHPRYCLLGNTGSCSRIVRHPGGRERDTHTHSLYHLFILNLLAHNSMHSGGVQLLSQSCPRLFPITPATASHSPSLLLPP